MLLVEWVSFVWDDVLGAGLLVSRLCVGLVGGIRGFPGELISWDDMI